MKLRIFILSYLFAGTCAFAQDRNYVFSDNGRWAARNSNFVYYLDVDSLLTNQPQATRISSLVYPVVHISDDCKTAFFIDHYRLIKGTPYKGDFIDRDTLPGPPIDGKIFKMTAEGKYLIATSTSLENGTPSFKGYQVLLLYLKEGEQYRLTDSIGYRNYGEYIEDADVSPEGYLMCLQSKIGWRGYDMDYYGRLSVANIPTRDSYTGVEIPSEGGTMFFTAFDQDSGSSVYQVNTGTWETRRILCSWELTHLPTQQFTFGQNVSVSPDGSTLGVLLTEYPFNSPIEPTPPAFPHQSVWVMNSPKEFSGKAVRLSDIGTFMNASWYNGNASYTKIELTNTRIFCTRAEGTIICFPSLSAPSPAFILNPVPYQRNVQPMEQKCTHNYIALDTIAEGEMHIIHVPVTNNAKDTLIIYRDMADWAYIDQPLPRDGQWLSNPSTLEIKGFNKPESEMRFVVPPGETVDLIVVQRFYYCGETVESVFNTSGSNCTGIVVSCTAARVAKPHDWNFLGNRTYPDGKLMETFSPDSTSGSFHFLRYSRTGVVLMDCMFDTDGNVTGTTRYDNGNICRQITKDGSEYSRMNFYEDGKQQSVNHFKNKREVGIAQRWYPNGALQSEAKFRSFLVLNVYLYKIKVTPSKGSSAQYYHEYYADGTIKYTVGYTWSGYHRGKWKYYGPDGTVRSVYARRDKNSTGNIGWISQLPKLYYPGYIHGHSRSDWF